MGKEHNKSILKATYSMLCDRLGNMSDTQWMNTLMTACDQCGLKNFHSISKKVTFHPQINNNNTKSFQKSDNLLYNLIIVIH